MDEVVAATVAVLLVAFSYRGRLLWRAAIKYIRRGAP
jgi:hypothetical protein